MAKMLWRSALALAVLFLLFVLYRLATPDASRAADVEVAPARAEAVEPLPYLEEVADAARTPAGGARSQATAPPADERAIQGWLAGREVALEARCVDLDGRPLEGVEVTVTQAGLSSSGLSDENGLVRIDRNLAWLDWALSLESFLLAKKRRGVWLFDHGETQVRVAARLEGWSDDEQWVQIRLGETVHAGLLVLAPAGTISGRVVDEAGAPVAGAQVGATSLDRRLEGPKLARGRLAGARHGAGISKEDGAFVLERVPAGPLRVSAHDARQRTADARLVDVRVGEHVRDLLLVLSETAGHALGSIEGLVVGDQGVPAAGATLRAVRRDPESGTLSIVAQHPVRTDGSFSIPSEGSLTLDAWDPKGIHGCARARDVEPGTRDLVLRLEDPRTILVEAVDERGAPVVPFRARVLELELEHVDSGLRVPAASRRIHGETAFSFSFPPGSARGAPAGALALVLPPRPFLVRASAVGREEGTLGPFDRADVPPTLRFVLLSRPALSGRVVRDGAPVSGASVTVCTPVLVDGLPGGVEQDGFPSRLLHGQKVKTDREGRFTVAPAETEFHLFVTAEGSAPSEVGPIALEPGHEAPEVEVVLSRGGDLEGEVIVDDGVDPSGIIVGISRGDGFARTQRTDRHGRFLFTLLTPGAWYVGEHYTEITPFARGFSSRECGSPEEWPESCTVVAGRTTRFRLDLREPPGRIVRGRLRLGSRPVAGWTAVLAPEQHALGPFSPSFATATLEGDGSFAATVRGTGTYRLAIAPIAGLVDACKVLATVEVGLDGADWSLVRESGTLEGELPEFDRRRARHLVLEPDGAAVLTRIDADTSGRFRVEDVPAGDGAIVVEPGTGAPSSTDPATWRVLARVDVPAGGSASVEVP